MAVALSPAASAAWNRSTVVATSLESLGDVAERMVAAVKNETAPNARTLGRIKA
jgi:hypothetical protein